MRIVSFESKYEKAVLELNEISVKQSEYNGETVQPGWHGDLARIKDEYLESGGAFLLWLDEGKLAGMGGLQRVNDTTANVKRVRVHPDYQRKGLSEEILTEIEKAARRRNYRKLMSNAAKGNLPAERMLRKAGFVAVEEKQFFSVLCTVFEKELKQERKETAVTFRPSGPRTRL